MMKQWRFLAMLIEISLTNRCTYSCKYCKPLNGRETEHFIDMHKLIKWLDAFTVDKDEVIIRLEGDGEPTCHDKLFDFCQYFSKRRLSIEIYTNCSKDLTYYIDLLKFENVSLVISWHQLANDIFNKQCLIKVKRLKQYAPDRISISIVDDGSEHIKMIKQICQQICKVQLYDMVTVDNADIYEQLNISNAKYIYIDETGKIYLNYRYSFLQQSYVDDIAKAV